MSAIFKRAWYALKLMFSGYFIGAVILGLSFTVVTVQIENWHFASASMNSLITMFTVVMPLFTIVLTANAFAEELEELTFPLLWTYPAIKWLLLLERLLMVILLVAFYLMMSLWAVHYWLIELTKEGIWEIVRAALPVHAIFIGITLLFSLVSRNMIAGLAAGTLYWLVEMITRGTWTKKLYLFQMVWPIEGYDPLEQNWWILSIAIALTAMSVIVFVFGRYWLAKNK